MGEYSRARAHGLPSQPANNVHFGPGVHSVGGGLLLGEADSGVVVSGGGPGITVLTGGTALPPWTVARDATTGRPLWSAPLAAASHPDGTAELHTQLFVQGGGGEPFRFGRRFTARSAVMSYSHASAVDPKRTASSTGQGKCKAPAITTRTTCSSRCSTAGLRRPTGLPASHR